MWDSDPSHPDVNRKIWQKPIQGSQMLAGSGELKQPLRALNKDRFIHVIVQCTMVKECLNKIIVEIEEHPFQKRSYITEKEAMEEFQTWKHQLEIFHVQMTKDDWLNLGDPNDFF